MWKSPKWINATTTAANDNYNDYSADNGENEGGGGGGEEEEEEEEKEEEE